MLVRIQREHLKGDKMAIFKKKSTKELIDKALSEARIKWEKEKNEEFLKYRNVWNQGKDSEQQLLTQEYSKKLQEKEKIIKKQEIIITNQKKAFRKFTRHVTDNEALSTELAAESEIFLSHISKLAGVFASLKHKAQITADKVEKNIDKDRVLKQLKADSYAIDD